MYVTVSIDDPRDIQRLADHLPQAFNPEHVVGFLKGKLSPAIRVVILEYPYVDKDYRSTYYAFYAKKGLKYDHFCVRLHFFGEGVFVSDDLELRCKGGAASNRYHGYMVLRPTSITPIGRTVISAQSKLGHRGSTIQAAHHVHLLGERLSVKGFPYMEQHTDVSVCAHAACWAILRHYSQKHGKYAEILVHDVTKLASAGDPGGLIPSRGLQIEQACQVFTRAGLFPDINSKNGLPNGLFFRILHAYVASGFPAFAAMFKKAHAVAVIGHGESKRDVMKGLSPPLYAWDSISSLIVMDDNEFPYLQIDALNPDPYILADIDAFVVALPEKVYLPAETVEERVLQLLTSGFPNLDMSYLGQPIIKYLVTTASRLREYLRLEKSAFPIDLYCALMELALPQFVWMVQLATLKDWDENRYTAFLLLDATASALEDMPYIVVHDKKTAFVYDRGLDDEAGWVTFDREFSYLPEFKNPLDYRT